MSQIAPLQPRTPQENLAAFRRFFADDPTKLDKKLDDYIRKLSQKKNYDPLPYYTVIFGAAAGQWRHSPPGESQPISSVDRAVGPARNRGWRGRAELGGHELAHPRPGHPRR